MNTVFAPAHTRKAHEQHQGPHYEKHSPCGIVCEALQSVFVQCWNPAAKLRFLWILTNRPSLKCAPSRLGKYSLFWVCNSDKMVVNPIRPAMCQSVPNPYISG